MALTMCKSYGYLNLQEMTRIGLMSSEILQALTQRVKGDNVEKASQYIYVRAKDNRIIEVSIVMRSSAL